MPLQVEVFSAEPERTQSDLPWRGFPTSWYQVAWSYELGPKDVKPLRYFGTSLVLYRSESGRPVVLDAFCGHLGAHLGHGGTVVGDDIVCPFHAWRWDPEGHNVDIPYSKRGCNRAVQMRSWPTLELDGLILVWYDAKGRPPEWEPSGLPEFSDEDFFPLVPHGEMKLWAGVRFQPQHVLENSADPAHLKYIHKNAAVPDVSRHDPDGPFFHFAFDTTYLTPDWGEVDGEIPGTWWGMGILTFRMKGVHDAAEYVTITPIDDVRSDMRISVVARRVDGGNEPTGIAHRIMLHQIKEVDRDIPIWEHMRYAAKPTLAVEEVMYFNTLRGWAAQFYPEPQ